jgi:predicted PurR-regulated permease PerM
MKKEQRREHHHLVRFVHNIGINKKYTTIALYALAVLSFALICIYFLLHPENYTSVFETVSSIVSPIFIGLIIAYLLNPFLEFFENVVFISKAKRTLLRSRRGLLQSKLAYDQVRLKPTSTEEEIQAVLDRLNDARKKLADARVAVLAEKKRKDDSYAKKASKKKTRPTFYKEPAKDRSHPMRALSLICTYILFIAIISLILWIVIPQCISSLMGLISNLERYIRAIPNRLHDLIEENEVIGNVYHYVSAEIDLHTVIHQFTTEASVWLTNLVSQMPNYAVTFFSKLASGITNLILSIFFSIYFLSSMALLGGQIKRFGKASLSPRLFHHTRHVIGEVDRKFGKFIEGKLLDSTIIGILALFALMIMGMPYYQMLALVIGITNIIPFFGPFIGAIIGGFIILISEPSKLIAFLIMVLILQQLDGNLIGPLILGDSLGLPPIWIMIAIVVMSGLLGFFGMLFGVPLFAVIYTLVQEAVESKLKKRKRKALELAAEAAEEAAAEANPLQS